MIIIMTLASVIDKITSLWEGGTTTIISYRKPFQVDRLTICKHTELIHHLVFK